MLQLQFHVASSSWAISLASFSEERPKCIRFNRALNFKFFDQQITAEKCAFLSRARGTFGVEFRALRSHEAIA